MARINIEDSVFKDGRFIDLCIDLGDKQKALGCLVWAFIIAQKYYLDESNDRLIPLNEWQRQSCENKLIDFGLAEIREKGVYVCGSENQFNWLIQRSEAGKKGGGSNRIKRQKKATVDQRSLTVEQPLTLTPSLTPSLSLNSYSSNNLKNSKKEKIPTDKSGGAKVWERYREKFLNRYGVEPMRNAKVNAQCKQLYERLGEGGLGAIDFYLTHNDSWYLKNQHDLGSLLAKAESIFTQWQRGHAVTSAQVRDAEKAIHKNDIKNELDNLFAEEK